VSSSPYSSERHKPFDPDISEEDRRLADEVSEDYDQRRQAEAETRNQKLQQIIDEGNAEIRKLLGGAENWLALRRLMRDEQITFHKLLQPPEGLTADYDELNAARVAAGQKFLAKIGVESSSLRDLYRRTAAAHAEVDVFPPADPGFSLETHHGQWIDLVQPPEPPPDVHAFQIFTPPFPGFQSGFSGFGAPEFQVARQDFLDPAAGLVGNDLTLDNPDASGLDLAQGIADTQVLFDFKAPTAGLVEVVIEAQSGLATHELRTKDEWGWSSSRTGQVNFLMMHVIHPNVTGPSFAQMSSFTVVTDATTSVQREFLARGGLFFADLFSDGPVQKDQVVEVRAGTESVNGSLTDDVEIHSKSAFHWFVKSVRVRIAP
jgi:hypothetical protein